MSWRRVFVGVLVLALAGWAFVTGMRALSVARARDPHRGAEVLASLISDSPILSLKVETDKDDLVQILAYVDQGEGLESLTWVSGDDAESEMETTTASPTLDSSPIQITPELIDEMLVAARAVDGNGHGLVTLAALPNGKMIRSETGMEGAHFFIDGQEVWTDHTPAKALASAREVTRAIGSTPTWSSWRLDPSYTDKSGDHQAALHVTTGWQSQQMGGKPCLIGVAMYQVLGADVSCFDLSEPKTLPMESFRDEVYASLVAKAGPTDSVGATVRMDGSMRWKVGDASFDPSGKPTHG